MARSDWQAPRPTVRRWVQNEHCDRVGHWLGQGELEAHVFRKAYMAQFYDVDRVEIGPPQASEKYSVAELLKMGLVGLYSYRYA